MHSNDSRSAPRFRGSPSGLPSRRGPSAQASGRRPQQSQRRMGVVKQHIPAARFIQAAQPVEVESYQPVHAFQDFALSPRLKANIVAKGYAAPTPIQDKTIPPALEGRDIVGIANTGTGKTAAFALPVLQQIVTDHASKALIMAPTRELAQQILEEMMGFARGCGIRAALLIGGASINVQKRQLRDSPSVVIGTPGRIRDHIGQGTLRLQGFNLVVLDEVDRMLDMGFIVPIRDILGRVNAQRQSFFFSATMESKIEKLIEGFSSAPLVVSVKSGSTAAGVEQDVVYYKSPEERLEKLHDILVRNPASRTIIFDDTKRDVEKLGRELHARGFKVDQIHGNKSQAQRSRALSRLKRDEIQILVATDVAARGIDVSDVGHVINFTVPSTYDDYVHRIGRAGRAGKTGVALTFLAG